MSGIDHATGVRALQVHRDHVSDAGRFRVARGVSIGSVAFACVAAGVASITFTGLRAAGNATVSDVLLLGGSLGLALSLLDPSWRVRLRLPGWLWISAGALVGAALLAELVPPSQPSRAALLFPGALLSGELSPTLTLPSNFGGAARIVGAMVAIPLIFQAVARSSGRIELLMNAWIGGVALGGLLAVVEYLGGPSLLGIVTGAPETASIRAGGLGAHVNTLAHASAMALPVAIAAAGWSRGASRWSYGLAALLMVAGIVVTGSRTGLAAGVLGVGLGAALSRSTRRGLLQVTALAIGLGAIAAVVVTVFSSEPAAAPPTIDRLLNPGGDAPSLSDGPRADVYAAVIGEIAGRPIVGHGFQYVTGSHNIYLQLAHSGGLLAVVGFLTFALGSATVGIQASREAVLPVRLRAMSRALVASVFVWLSFGLLAAPIAERYLFVPTGLLIAIWALKEGFRVVGRGHQQGLDTPGREW